MADRSRLSPLFGWRGEICESDLDSTSRLVALVLSLHMSELGESAFPSVSTLAKQTGLTDRSVQVHLRYLVDTGFLERTDRKRPNGSDTSSIYTAVIHMGEGGSPSPPKDVHQGGESGSPPSGGARGSPPEDVLGRNSKNGGSRPLTAADYRRQHLQSNLAAMKLSDLDFSEEIAEIERELKELA